MQLPLLLKGLVSLAVNCIGDLYCCINFKLYGTADSTRRLNYAYWCSFQPVVLRRIRSTSWASFITTAATL